MIHISEIQRQRIQAVKIFPTCRLFLLTAIEAELNGNKTIDNREWLFSRLCKAGVVERDAAMKCFDKIVNGLARVEKMD